MSQKLDDLLIAGWFFYRLGALGWCLHLLQRCAVYVAGKIRLAGVTQTSVKESAARPRVLAVAYSSASSCLSAATLR